ncbi:MAG: MoxR family ATPase [Candidatus Eremiobacteraeota bacterium]|nr:MoxR family ATPase [Candidatus Eremiobacteraeota bacterium]
MSQAVRALAERLTTALGTVLVGSDQSAFALQVALFGRGHVLIEGVPGTGKTLLVRTFSLLLGLQFRRIQFTPDLMPADVVGTTVFNPKTAEFATRPGPIVANIILADEINRTPPKTQSALLEAMEEGRVTIDGVPLRLPTPFMLCATQNPIEYEGTYPLPEAQLDRFMLKIPAGYPALNQELTLLARGAAGFDAHDVESSGLTPVTSAAEVLDAQRAVRAVHVAESLQRYVFDIIAATRTSQHVALGASPRAGLALLVAAQGAAAIDGRDFVTPDDVKDITQITLAHRLIVHPHAEIEGVTATEIIDGILKSVAVPKDAAAAAS